MIKKQLQIKRIGLKQKKNSYEFHIAVMERAESNIQLI